jgi:hypothetical protein
MMAANPEVQRTAQAEIANAIGACTTLKALTQTPSHGGGSIQVPARLPGFNDRSQLPYLEAIFKEVMRFNPGLSMGEHRPLYYYYYTLESRGRFRRKAFQSERDPTQLHCYLMKLVKLI